MTIRLTPSPLRLNGYVAVSTGILNARLQPAWIRHQNVAFHGPYRIAGTVQRLNPPLAPAQRMVVLLDRGTLYAVRSVVSDASGAYAFENLAMRKYLVMAMDTPNGLNAAVADHQLPGLA